MQNFMKDRKQPPVVILQQASFYNKYIWRLWLRTIRRSVQGVQFMNFPSQIFFNDINHGYIAAIMKKNYVWLLPLYMVVATYCYYENVHQTMHNAIVSYLLKQNGLLLIFSTITAAKLNNCLLSSFQKKVPLPVTISLKMGLLRSEIEIPICPCSPSNVTVMQKQIRYILFGISILILKSKIPNIKEKLVDPNSQPRTF